MTRRLRFNLAGAAVLVIGLLTALLIYLTAADAPVDALGYQFADGTVYAVQPGDSKMYRHELERFGGKAAVFADELERWFSGLWKGKRLAGTVTVISLLAALGFFHLARACGRDESEGGER